MTRGGKAALKGGEHGVPHAAAALEAPWLVHVSRIACAALRLGKQRRPLRHVIVPFDQARDRTNLRDDVPKESHDRIGDGRAMRVDQQARTDVIALGMTREMNFTDMLKREAREIAQGIRAVIHRGDVDVVNVEQEPATGAARDLVEEIGLVEGRLREADVSRGVFDQNSAPQRGLNLIHMGADEAKCFFRIGQRQKVVVKGSAMARPGEMFRNRFRLGAAAKILQPGEMVRVERFSGSDRQADAMNGKRVIFADLAELRMRPATAAHVIFRMDLEEAEWLRRRDDGVKMLRFEADAPRGLEDAAAGSWEQGLVLEKMARAETRARPKDGSGTCLA